MSKEVLCLIMLVIFFAVMIYVGFYSRKHATDVDGFVLGGRGVGPWLTAFAFGARATICCSLNVLIHPPYCKTMLLKKICKKTGKIEAAPQSSLFLFKHNRNESKTRRSLQAHQTVFGYLSFCFYSSQL